MTNGYINETSAPLTASGDPTNAPVNMSEIQYRLVREHEYDNVLGRFQNVWAHLNDQPPECAPRLAMDIKAEYPNAAFIHTEKGEDIFIVHEKLLHVLEHDEIDAILYHEVGHQICGHQESNSTLDRLNIEERRKKELQADSVAVVHGYGDELISGLRKIETYNEKEKEESLLERYLPSVSNWIDKVRGQFTPHPPNEVREQEASRVYNTYCTTPDKEADCSINEKNNQLKNVLMNYNQEIECISNEINNACNVPETESCASTVDRINKSVLHSR